MLQAFPSPTTFYTADPGPATVFGRLAEKVANPVPAVVAESLLRILKEHKQPSDKRAEVAALMRAYRALIRAESMLSPHPLQGGPRWREEQR